MTTLTDNEAVQQAMRALKPEANDTDTINEDIIEAAQALGASPDSLNSAEVNIVNAIGSETTDNVPAADVLLRRLSEGGSGGQVANIRVTEDDQIRVTEAGVVRVIE